MAESKVTRIPGVFPIVDIERDKDDYPIKVVIKGVMDELVMTVMTTSVDPQNAPWIDVKINGEDWTLHD